MNESDVAVTFGVPVTMLGKSRELTDDPFGPGPAYKQDVVSAMYLLDLKAMIAEAIRLDMETVVIKLLGSAVA